MLGKLIPPAHICFLAILESCIENKAKDLDSLLEDQGDENFDPRNALTKIFKPKLADYIINRILVL